MVNAPPTFTAFYEPLETTYETVSITIALTEVDGYRDRVDQGEWQAILIFPPNFETTIGGNPRPQVYLYSNPNDPISSTVAGRFQNYLTVYETALAEAVFGDTSAFLIRMQGPEVNPDLQSGIMLSMLLPMLTVMFMFSGAMSIGPESIAGEKERGTIATLLITPVKRREIALGKILSLGVLSLLSAISSFLGIALSFNNLFPEGTVSFSAYGVTAMLQILLLLFSTVFVIVGIIAIISAYAKNLKEAGTLIMPVYILTILTGVTSMFNSGANQNLLFYFVPDVQHRPITDGGSPFRFHRVERHRCHGQWRIWRMWPSSSRFSTKCSKAKKSCFPSKGDEFDSGSYDSHLRRRGQRLNDGRPRDRLSLRIPPHRSGRSLVRAFRSAIYGSSFGDRNACHRASTIEYLRIVRHFRFNHRLGRFVQTKHRSRRVLAFAGRDSHRPHTPSRGKTVWLASRAGRRHVRPAFGVSRLGPSV
ncbi:MAG: ABC transporter permease [Bacillus subtilis]|nr:ABC transporter permease [Bacillus subtilis]